MYLFPFSGEGMEAPTLLGSLERANFNHSITVVIVYTGFCPTDPLGKGVEWYLVLVNTDGYIKIIKWPFSAL
jgi:hypothetical protein